MSAKRELDFLSLASAEDDFLEELMRAGKAPDADKLVGWEFKGYHSLDLSTVLGLRKFKSGFYRCDGNVCGYKVKVEQNGLIDPWVDQIKKGESLKHGWYDVLCVDPEGVDNLYPDSLLLSYDSARKPKLAPSRAFRDYLVQVDPDDTDLYLGKAYVAIGPRRVFVSYFALERENPSSL